jgi:hypothetical protein
MARAKRLIRKFKNPELNRAIELRRPSLAWTDTEMTKFTEDEQKRVHAEMMRKTELMFAEYQIPRTAEFGAKILLLCFGLLADFVPGFRVVEKAAGVGRPKKDNLFTEPTFLTVMVDVLKRNGMARTDTDAYGILAEAEDPTLKSLRARTRRAKRVRRLANIGSAARAAARRKFEGKAH